MRFGGDKLAAVIDGESMLGLSASALAASGFEERVAVVSKGTKIHEPRLRELGFDVALNAEADEGMSSSIRAGVGWAQSRGANAVLIALADMPYVSATHLLRLSRKFDCCTSGLAYSVSAGRRAPPAIFSRNWFDRLRALEGDAGARAFLVAASASDGVEAPYGMLDDIDSQQDLARS